MWAARKIERPVKWRCERSEVILADEHGRDNVGTIELAFDANAKIIGLRLHMLASIGAYIASDRQLLTPFGQIGTVVGMYDIPAAYVTIDAVLSNTSPTAPYRGAGRPEASYLIERAMEAAARELSIDPIELRRRNLIPQAKMPYKTALGPFYDCGEFSQNMEMALEAADHAGFAARREASRARGMLRGLGFANAIEQAAGPTPEYAEIRFQPSGSAILLMGTKTHGQGHETVFKQILCERLGIDPKEVQFIDGDTDRVAFGMGSNGSRSMVVGGSALTLAAEKIIDKGKRIAAHVLEAAEADIEFADGRFSVAGTDRGVTLKDVARAAFQPARLPPGMEPGFYEHATYAPTLNTFPNGCHVCEVEIDPDTGVVDLQSYLVVDDVGTVINPLTLAGQIHGGVAQGRRPDPDGAGGLRTGIRPVADCKFHGLLHAARRRHVQHAHRLQPGADRRQPARCEGCRRGRLCRRAAGGDERHHACAGTARCARTRHAGDERSHLARNPRREGGLGARSADRRRVPQGAARRTQGLGHWRRRRRRRHHPSRDARHGG